MIPLMSLGQPERLVLIVESTLQRITEPSVIELLAELVSRDVAMVQARPRQVVIAMDRLMSTERRALEDAGLIPMATEKVNPGKHKAAPSPTPKARELTVIDGVVLEL